MTKNGHTLRQLLLDYANNRQSFRRAKNRTQFMALWPAIREMLAEGWTQTAVCEVLKANQWLDLHYASFRRYVREQRKMDAGVQPVLTPKKEAVTAKTVPIKETNTESKGEKRAEDADTPSYSVPPKFGRRTDELDDVAFMLGKVEK